MANVMSLKSFKNSVKRNGFDLSHKNAFTAKAGELLPIFCQEVIPGDKFRINGQGFTRTQPIMSAAFVRLREYYDFFFVPYKLLWNRFPTFFTQLQDYHQASGINAASTVGEQHPYFSSSEVLAYLSRVNTAQDGKDSNLFGYKRADLSAKLLEYLGYGVQDYVSPVQDNPVVLNPCPLLAYQKVCQDYFRDDQWQNAEPWRYNLDYITDGSSPHIPVSTIDISQNTMFDLNYCNYAKDYFMGMLPSSQYGEEAFVAIGAGTSGSELTGDLVIQYPRIGIVQGQPLQDGEIRGSMVGELMLDTPGESPAYPITKIYNQGADGGSPAVFTLSSPLSSSGNLSILALRQAEALQKWKEIAQSGRQDYQTQMQKHFGVNPSDAMSNHCKYLGGWTSNIDINEVVNNNLDADSSQADIKGKGVGVSRGNVEFDAKEHGILIGLYHCMPLLDYNTNGIKKFNMKSFATDYAIPEFDSIGMQQLSGEELLYKIDVGDSGVTSSLNVELGWVPRYADYKTAIDEVHGEFNDSLKYWVSPLTSEYLSAYFEAVKAKYGSYKVTYEFFKVNPSILDNLFGTHVDSTTQTDQFLVNAFFDCKAVRNLDYNGLPY